MRCDPLQIQIASSDASMRADAYRLMRTEDGAVTSPPALTTTRGYAQWLTTA